MRYSANTTLLMLCCQFCAVGTDTQGTAVPPLTAALGMNLADDAAPEAALPATATATLERLERSAQAEKSHPLTPWIQYALDRFNDTQRSVRDHSCVLIKRERIDGVLSDYQYMITKTRYEQKRGLRTVVPLSIFLHYFGPAKLKGRKVVYVAGENDGKLLVRKGGRRFGFVTMRLDPNSDAARRESHYRITEMGIDHIIKRLIERARLDMEADPAGENTQVNFFRDAKINRRACVRVQVIHPERQAGLNFHHANIYVDDLLQVPIRIEAYDWPKDTGGDAPLMEEFTYANLKLNVGLKADDFKPQVLD